MHEVSLARSIFRSLEEQFTIKELANISSISLKIGVLSNVEPILLRNAYQAVAATDYATFKDVELKIEIVPPIVKCPKCERTSEVINYHFKCGHCDHPTNNIVQGTELMIAGVEMR
ncbi:MAG: hydrogenase maturation nickel metallochaperone HypA [Bacteroidota bacterium]